jgi:hypothetical protein
MGDVFPGTRILAVEVAAVRQQLGGRNFPCAVGFFTLGPPRDHSAEFIESDKTLDGFTASASRRDLTGGDDCWHLVPVMSITVQLELPEAVAAEAKARGLLDPKNLTRLIQREIEAESARRDYFEMVQELRALPGEPMTMDEIQAEVDAVRAERAARENRR